MGIDGGDYVLPRNSLLVELSVLVGILHLIARVPQEHVVALLATKVLLAGGLEAGLSDVVSALVGIRFLLDIPLVHFRHVSQQVASGVEGILPHGTHLPAEAREIVGPLREAHVFLHADLLGELQGLPAYARTVFLVVGHLLPYPEGVQVQRLSQGKSVESLHFAGRDQDVVADAVAHQHLPVSVVDDAAGRIDGVVYHGIVGRIPLVAVIHYLNGEEPHQQDEDDGPEANDQFVAAAYLHLSASLGASTPAT